MPVLSLLGATSCAFEYLDAADGPLLRPLDPAAAAPTPARDGRDSPLQGQDERGLHAGAPEPVALRRPLPHRPGRASPGPRPARRRRHDALRRAGGRPRRLRDRAGETRRRDDRGVRRRVLPRGSHSALDRPRQGEAPLPVRARPARTTNACSCSLRATPASADSVLADVPGGARFHAIATDLPYGIQHDGAAVTLVREALPAWERVLLPGGAMALAWDATRLPREKLTEVVTANSGLVGPRRRPLRRARAPRRPRDQAARRARRRETG